VAGRDEKRRAGVRPAHHRTAFPTPLQRSVSGSFEGGSPPSNPGRSWNSSREGEGPQPCPTLAPARVMRGPSSRAQQSCGRRPGSQPGQRDQACQYTPPTRSVPAHHRARQVAPSCDRAPIPGTVLHDREGGPGSCLDAYFGLPSAGQARHAALSHLLPSPSPRTTDRSQRALLPPRPPDGHRGRSCLSCSISQQASLTAPVARGLLTPPALAPPGIDLAHWSQL